MRNNKGIRRTTAKVTGPKYAKPSAARGIPVGRAGGTAIAKKRGPGPVKAYGAPTRKTVKLGQRKQRAQAARQGARGARKSARKARRKPTAGDFSRHM